MIGLRRICFLMRLRDQGSCSNERSNPNRQCKNSPRQESIQLFLQNPGTVTSSGTKAQCSCCAFSMPVSPRRGRYAESVLPEIRGLRRAELDIVVDHKHLLHVPSLRRFLIEICNK